MVQKPGAAVRGGVSVALLGLLAGGGGMAGCTDPGVDTGEDVGPAVWFSPPPGDYFAEVAVTLETNLEGLTIRWSTDGTDPNQPYTDPIALPLPEQGTTRTELRAVAEGTAGTSEVEVGVYNVTAVGDDQVQPVVFWPPAGTYAAPPDVELGSATPGAAIYYTLDGSEPSASSTAYSGPITVTETLTLRALAVDGDGEANGVLLPSPVSSATYVADPEAPSRPALAPVFTPEPGTEVNPVQVALFNPLGTPIYYTFTTTDDVDTPAPEPPEPTSLNGTQYTAPLVVGRQGFATDGALQPGRVRIKAVAVGQADGTTYTPSPVTDAEYVMDLAITRWSAPTIALNDNGTVTEYTSSDTVSLDPDGGPYSLQFVTDEAGPTVFYIAGGEAPSDPDTAAGTPIEPWETVDLTGEEGDSIRYHAWVDVADNEYSFASPVLTLTVDFVSP